MDNNNQNPTTPTPPSAPTPPSNPTPTPTPVIPEPVITPPVTEPQPAQPVENTATKPPHSGSNKIFMVVGVLLIVAVFAAAGIYLFANYNSQPSSPASTDTQTQSAPVVTLTLTPTPSSPSSQLEDINVDNPESDLNNVNQDVNQL